MFITDEIFQIATEDIYACEDADDLMARKDSSAFYITDAWEDPAISHLIAGAMGAKQLMCLVEEDGELFWADDQMYVNRLEYAIFTKEGMNDFRIIVKEVMLK